MALRLITGVPGSGKSFYAVNHIAKKYCDSVGDTYQLKKDYVIVTNITELLLDSVDLDSAIQKSGSLERFFSIEIQEKVTKKYQADGKKLVYVIDEAQQFFHRKFYDRTVFAFFEGHRHQGLDIFLITQNSNLLAKDLLSLVEIEIRAVPRTLSLGGFNYLKKSNKDIIGRSALRKNKKIFALYKSMQVAETEKIRSPYLKYCIPVILLFIAGLYGLSKSFLGRAVGLPNVNTSFASNPGVTSEKTSTSEETSKSVFTPVSYVLLTGTRNEMQVYDPINNLLVSADIYPYPIRFYKRFGKVSVYAQLPITEKKEN